MILVVLLLSMLNLVHAGDKIKMAVTVDDLPLHMSVPPGVDRIDIARKYLAALKKHRVPEVYGFVNAEKLEHDPKLIEVLKAWRDAGYPLGNHTWDHRDLINQDVDAYKEGILKDEPILKKLSGSTDYKYFRYPFLHEGATLAARNNVRDFLKAHDYKIAEVSIDFDDWAWNDPYSRCVAKKDQASVDWLRKEYLRNASDRLDRAVRAANILWGRPILHVLLLHIGSMDADIMDELLSLYESKGVEFIPLTEALKDPIYALDFPDSVTSDGITFLALAAKGMKKAAFIPYEGFPEEKLQTVCQ